MKTIFLFRGVPGAGKSNDAHILASNCKSAIVLAADDYFEKEGGYDFDPSKLGYAHKECQENAEKAMQMGLEAIFVTNTFTKERDMKPYLKLAEKYGYRVSSHVVENRHGNKDVHGVPMEVRIRMATELISNIKLLPENY